MAAAMAGGKGRKKKWSKNKSRDKILNEVLFKETTYERMMSDVPKVSLMVLMLRLSLPACVTNVRTATSRRL